MSSVQEIQEAIALLPENERLALVDWIHSRDLVEGLEHDSQLRADASEGERQIDAGLGMPLEEVRKLAIRWTTK
jgi:hypothetical protein